jgi:hypothetical protein
MGAGDIGTDSDRPCSAVDLDGWTEPHDKWVITDMSVRAGEEDGCDQDLGCDHRERG